MRGFIRKAALSLVAISLLAALSAGLIWWSLRTQWFADAVKTRLISSLQKATGGRVELKSFHFDPATFEARADGLLVHGLEPPGSAPLFSIASAEVQLKILSLLSRSSKPDINIHSLNLTRPAVNLLIQPNGSTNIPQPQTNVDVVGQLLDLKIGHLQLSDGVMRVNSRQFPFHLLADNIGVMLTYRTSGPSYSARLQSKLNDLSFGSSVFKPMQVSAEAQVFKNRAEISSLRILSQAGSELQLSGEIRNFANPSADGDLKGSLSIDELTTFGGIHNSLRGGRAQVDGQLHFAADSADLFLFKGRAKVRNVLFESPGLTLRNIAAESDVVASKSGMLLRHALASVDGAQFSGEGSIRGYQWLEVNGHVSHIALPAVGRYLTHEYFPWSGTASGTARATAQLRPDSNLIIQANVAIERGAAGIPTQGNIDFSYTARGNEFSFGSSDLQLPNTQLQFQGSLHNALLLKLDTDDLNDLLPVLPILKIHLRAKDLPKFSASGSGHFEGELQNLMASPTIRGKINAGQFLFHGYQWDSVTAQLAYSEKALSIDRLQVQQSGALLDGSGAVALSGWLLDSSAPLRLAANFTGVDLVKMTQLLGYNGIPVVQGILSGSLDAAGSLNAPRGSGSFQISNLDAYGEQLNRSRFDAVLSGDMVEISKGRVQASAAVLDFSGSYRRSVVNWAAGELRLQVDTSGFPIASSATIRRFLPGLSARAELHFHAAARFTGSALEPERVNGNAEFTHVSVEGRELGGAALRAVERGQAIDFTYEGNLLSAPFHGSAHALLASGTPLQGNLQGGGIDFATLRRLVPAGWLPKSVNGFLEGSATFEGLLEKPKQIHAQAVISKLEASSTGGGSSMVVHNMAPIVMELSEDAVRISKFQVAGPSTSFEVSGTVPLSAGKPVSIKAGGTLDLGLLMLFQPNLRSSGRSQLALDVSGNLPSPNISGSLQIQNASLFVSDLPNGLSDVNGSVLFSRNRATIQKMTAHSGGGDVSLGGTVSYGVDSPLVYHLEAAAHEVRVRYGNSISVTANSDLRLSGTSASSILSGTLIINRIVFTPNADAGSLLAAVGAAPSTPADQSYLLAGLHLDVSVESAPNLQVSTNLSRDVEAELQLSLRGTPEHPIVLGNIIANQGDLKIFGTRFSLNRGEVSFVNTVRIEPVLDLDLETQARGVTVDITVSGTPSKLNFNYRSDPPLQPRDIIALLTVGRTPDVGASSNAQSGSDVSALKTGVNSVLGQAISPVSNRLSKLFGITSIKIDPFVQGITNTPQARLSIEQQISRNVTITYVTNLSQTSEQIFRFEWALNHQFSIVALRDDNGEFGLDFQYKKRFK